MLKCVCGHAQNKHAEALASYSSSVCRVKGCECDVWRWDGWTKKRKEVFKMAYIDMELVKGPELRSIIEALNGSGLLAEPIDLKKGRRVANLAGDFVKAIEACNAAGTLDNVPEAVFNYYVHVVKEGDPPDTGAKKAADKEAKAAEKKAKADAKKAAAEKKAATEAAKAEAEKQKVAKAEAEAAKDKKAQATAKKAQAAADKKAKAAAAKKAKADKAKAAKRKAAKAKGKPVLVKAAIFGKLLLSKKTKKWDVTELVNELAAKTDSPYVDTRRKCNTYIALLRTMGVLEDAGEALVLSEWYRKALANK